MRKVTNADGAGAAHATDAEPTRAWQLNPRSGFNTATKSGEVSTHTRCIFSREGALQSDQLALGGAVRPELEPEQCLTVECFGQAPQRFRTRAMLTTLDPRDH